MIITILSSFAVSSSLSHILSDSVNNNPSPLRFFLAPFLLSPPTSSPSSQFQPQPLHINQKPGSRDFRDSAREFPIPRRKNRREKNRKAKQKRENKKAQAQIEAHTMAEEHRCQAPEGHRLCANNCGFFGSLATMNLCSKCFSEQESTKSTIETALSSTSAATDVPSSAPSTSSSPAPQAAAVESFAPQVAEFPSSSLTIAANPGAPVQLNRCAMCRKRVGLTGFMCRCGVTFCGTHRYPEKHACSFDFKTVGREEIARANPVIKAEKLKRI